MIHLIDYYSFTIPVERVWENFPFHLNRDFVIDHFIRCFEDTALLPTSADDWCTEKGRGFYFWRIRCSTLDATLSFGGVNQHILVECAGLACANLDSINALMGLIHRTADLATRIDFAVDIETDTLPPDFCEQRGESHFSAGGNITSGRGITNYVGGRQSDRMARVYRYFPPHPRSAYLRVEAEYKRGAAKAAAKALDGADLVDVSLSVHAPFKWSHPDWKWLDGTTARLTYRHGGRDEAGSVHWLYGTVISAVTKAANNGLIDFEEWLKTLRSGLK